jgi:hypothetical protein
MMEFVATPMRQRKCRITIADACQFRRQIGEPMGNKMHNIALALNASVGSQHGGRKDDPPLRLKDP